VDAGGDVTITLPTDTVSLKGTVTDDGLPAGGKPSATWSKASGPGLVTFGDASALQTSATFPGRGVYVLRLTVSDGQLEGTDDVTVTVQSTAGADSDGDGMNDDWETANGLDPQDPTDAAKDPDSDGLTNVEEYGAGTLPQNADTDADGLTDGDEVNLHLTDPTRPDSDSDGMTDGWEAANGLDPRNGADAALDPDGDDYTNLEEYRAGTDPQDPDSFPKDLGWTCTAAGAPGPEGIAALALLALALLAAGSACQSSPCRSSWRGAARRRS
jgi:hypothetical protein